MMAKFMVNGEEKELRYEVDGIDASADLIGNTHHGMDKDDEGRYIASQEDYDWWETYFADLETLEETIARYKENFDRDEVDRVVQDAISGFDYGDQPRQAILELEQVFGAL
jgi:hypothetical protein